MFSFKCLFPHFVLWIFMLYKYYFRLKETSSRALCLGQEIFSQSLEYLVLGVRYFSANPRNVCKPYRANLNGLTLTKEKQLNHPRQQLPQGIGTYQTYKGQFIHNRT